MSVELQLSCRECGREFTFTSGEAAFYASRGLNRPRRCPMCRTARTAGQSGSSEVGPGDTGPRRQKFHAICTSCGQDAVAPFEPQPGRRVFCSTCFEIRSSPTHSHLSERSRR
jgi:CxxC-x17-CxxC domain-containing protein